MKAVGEFMVVQFEEPSEKLDNGLYRPANAAGDHKVGKVVEVGSKVADVKVGDKVIAHIRSGVKVPVEGVEYTVLKESEILVIL